MWLETLLAIFMIASVLISSKDLISFIIQIFTLDAIPSYDMFQKILIPSLIVSNSSRISLNASKTYTKQCS